MQKELINLPKLKQELFPVIILSVSHVWLTFQFPPYLRLGTPWSYIVCALVSGISIIVCVIAFSLANNCISYLNFESFDQWPLPQLFAKEFKLLTKLSIIASYFMIMAFYWYIDFFRMSHFYYVVLYAHTTMCFLLWYRAVYRKPCDNL